MENASLVSKPHFPILDGLRGVAAIMVVCFHLCEAHSAGPQFQLINHGYLAVDFFFLLSGFVVGYAYDDRWNKMSITDFFKRRLIRLQPMVIAGSVIGAACFYFQASGLWPGIAAVPVWKVVLLMLVGFTLIPILPSMDIRGWSEMHPLNGPCWSLFFEYVANIFYALVVRHFSRALLTVLVVLSAAALIHYTVTSKAGDVIGGWALDPSQLRIGFTRMMYPFFAGLLLFRTGARSKLKYAFLFCSVILILVLSIPRIGSDSQAWMNGLYESLVIIFIFPLIVYAGAGGTLVGGFTKKINKFLGDLSYPLYITHYPLIYIYTGWVYDHKISLRQGWPVALLVLSASISISYAFLKFYDEPVRQWLKNRYLTRNAS